MKDSLNDRNVEISFWTCNCPENFKSEFFTYPWQLHYSIKNDINI